MTITISIDDVHPQKGWRILGDPTETWLRKLHEDFGAKFTCFVPSNYHGEFPLSEHKEWVQELNSIPWIELAAHGHLHMTSDVTKFGECEFAELDFESAKNRIAESWDEWFNSDVMPIGFRPPGWLVNQDSRDAILYAGGKWYEWGMWETNWFEYVAIHYNHNNGLDWNCIPGRKKCKTFFGHDGIQQSNISIHSGDMVMFTSHISGDWNKNVWNEWNFEQLRLSLSHLYITEDCNFKTLKECI